MHHYDALVIKGKIISTCTSLIVMNSYHMQILFCRIIIMQLIYDMKNDSGSIGIISFKPHELPAYTRDAVTRIGVKIPKERLEAC